MSVKKTMREVEKLLPSGYSVRVHNRGKHHHAVYRPDGEPLRDEHGKTIPVATTPGDRRHLANLLSRVHRAIRSEGGTDATTQEA